MELSTNVTKSMLAHNNGCVASKEIEKMLDWLVISSLRDINARMCAENGEQRVESGD